MATAPADHDGTVRVFVSSTFRDMQSERDVLVKSTFPALRAKLRTRGLELTEIDLRWGIDEAQAERGETLKICLREITRCDVFLGLIGDRYGWTPPAEAIAGELTSTFPVVAAAQGSSVTELEIAHGVLSKPGPKPRALFFFRNPDYVAGLPTEEAARFVEAEPDPQRRLQNLKERIRASGARVIAYETPQSLGPLVEEALGALIERDWPDIAARDADSLSERLHAAYARERRHLFIGAEARFAPLDAWVDDAAVNPTLLIEGASGSGKSALLANWLARRRALRPNDIVCEHYLAAAPDSADPLLLLRRLLAVLARKTEGDANLPSDGDALAREAPDRIAAAAAYAAGHGGEVLIALDALDKLADQTDLRWLPETLGPGVRLIASSLEGPAHASLVARGAARTLVAALNREDQEALAVSMLAEAGKSLSTARLDRVLSHPLANSPLFLLTVLNELKVLGAFDQLDQRMDFYLGAKSLPQLFTRVLERLEQEHGADLTSLSLALVHLSRAGLEETELVAMTDVAPVAWSALSLGLGANLRNAAGRIAFAHDFMRAAVAERYLSDATTINTRRRAIADRFLERDADDARSAEEAPYQLREAGALEPLHALLVDLGRFDALFTRGPVELHTYWRALAPTGADAETDLIKALALKAGDGDAWDERAATLALEIADYLSEAGARGEGSLHLLRQVAAARTRLFGEDDPRTLRALSPLSEALRLRGAFDEAQKLNEKLIAAASRTLGDEHFDTLVYVNNLGLTLLGKGDYAAALTHFARVLALQRRSLAPDDPALLTGINNLAVCQRALGDYAGAFRLQSEDLAARRKRYGGDSPESAAALYNMATTTELLGDEAGAMRLNLQALDIRERTLGPHHPNTLASKHAVARALMRAGDLVAARALQEEVAAAFNEVYGPDHNDTLMALGNLGATLQRMGETEEAKALLTRVATTRAAQLGADHADTLLAQAALANAEGGAAGLARLEQTIAAHARLFGEDHPKTLEHRAALVAMRYNEGDAAGALALADAVCVSRIRVLGGTHPQTRAAAEQALTAAITLGDPVQIEKQARRFIALSEASDALDAPAALTAASALGMAMVALGSHAEAKAVLQPNLERLTRLEGSASRATFAGTWPLALAHLHLGEVDAAVTLLTQLARAASDALGESDPEALNFLGMLANAHVKRGNFLEAAAVFDRIAAANSGQSAEASAATLQARENAAMAYAHGGELARALNLLQTLHKRRRATLGANHGDVQRLAAQIAEVRGAMQATGRRQGAAARARAPHAKRTARTAWLWVLGAVIVLAAVFLATQSAL